MPTKTYLLKPLDDPTTLEQLTSIFAQVFNSPSLRKAEQSYLEEPCKNKCFFALGSFLNRRIVGGLTGYLLPCYFNKNFSFYLYNLAVLPSFRRQGIGKILINYTKTYCKKRGIKELFVQTHKEKHTLHFYQSTKPDKIEEAILFSYACNPALEQ